MQANSNALTDTLQQLLELLFSPAVIAIFSAIAFLVILLTIYLVTRAKNQPAPQAAISQPAPQPSPAVAAHTAAPDGVTEGASTDAVERETVLRRIPAIAEIKELEDAGDFAAAAALWRQRGDLAQERAALRKADEPMRLGAVELALGFGQSAVEEYRKSLEHDPDNASLRLRLTELLLDTGRREEADAVTDAYLKGGSHDRKILAGFGKAYESAGDLVRAKMLYEEAGRDLPLSNEANVRVQYLQELERLLKLPRRPRSASPLDYLREEIMDSTPGFEVLKKVQEAEEPPPPDTDEGPNLARVQFDALIGHLALGGLRHEAEHSVKSAAAVATRFHLSRLVGKSQLSVVFHGTDALLDYPVALRLARVDFDDVEYRVLRKRLQAISRLNHPNLAKLTYADRCGDILRLAHDYQSGGSLADLIDDHGPISVAVALRVSIQLASALAMTHGCGILHGDVRPSNVMIGKDNLVKLTDFALQPWLVRGFEMDETRTSPNARLEAEDVQMDIGQLAEVLGFIRENAEISPIMREKLGGYDPLAEYGEVVRSARDGAFSAVSQLHKVLQQIAERTSPTIS